LQTYNFAVGMKIGFDAKRTFLNNTGLGNYSRDTIRVLSHFFPENKFFKPNDLSKFSNTNSILTPNLAL
jgi:hypothetical protein